ncbi:MAG: tripartite tricarboxylate transporter substrate binding protein [Pigmentiphaga sp.]|nr:tripartite tricarboxylate transporter substrate binding protein [Pigmentiphaga sp.]
MSRRITAWLAVSAIALLATAPVHAFPDKPVRIIVPFPAGGVTDAMIRLLQAPVSADLGQPVIVENRPGAAGAIGARATLEAGADGYTIFMVNTGLVGITPYVQDNADIDFSQHFRAVAGLTSAPSVLLVNPEVPADSLPAFIDYAQAHPGRVNYAVAGRGAYSDLSTDLFARQAGLEMVAVPYQGNAPATIALLGNEVQMQLTILSSAMNGYIRDGRIKALGVATREPSPLVPGVPPIAETLPGFEAVVYTGIVAPAGVPDDVVRRLSDAFTSALANPELEQRLFDMGMESAALDAAAYDQRIASEIATFAPAVQAFVAQTP